MTMKKAAQVLKGTALLEKIKELDHMSYEEKAKSCGYYMITKDGKERILKIQFNKALMEALGLSQKFLAKADRNTHRSSVERGGRSPSYRVTVQTNGSILIGNAYTKKMKFQPGDQFEIVLGRKNIYLNKLDNSESFLPNVQENNGNNSSQ